MADSPDLGADPVGGERTPQSANIPRYSAIDRQLTSISPIRLARARPGPCVIPGP
ncbi:MAG TPA: hypothetical protein VGI84_01095 [Pseudonocardiaceae bacterium]